MRTPEEQVGLFPDDQDWDSCFMVERFIAKEDVQGELCEEAVDTKPLN